MKLNSFGTRDSLLLGHTAEVEAPRVPAGAANWETALLFQQAGSFPSRLAPVHKTTQCSVVSARVVGSLEVGRIQHTVMKNQGPHDEGCGQDSAAY